MLMVAGLLLPLSTSVHSASFDCNKASNFAEREVCADEALSSLDDKLSALYKKVRKTAGNWREGQLKWLKKRNHCKSKTCLLSAYQTRVAYFASALDKQAETNTTSDEKTAISPIKQGNQLTLTRYKDEAFCTAIAKPLTDKINISKANGPPVFSDWQAFDFPDKVLPMYFPRHKKPGSLIGGYQYLDFDGDGEKEFIIRERTWIRGKDYHVLYFFEDNEIDLTKAQQWADFKGAAKVNPFTDGYKILGSYWGPIVNMDLIEFNGEIFFLLFPNEFTRSDYDNDKFLAVYKILDTDLIKNGRKTRNIEDLCLFKAKQSLII